MVTNIQNNNLEIVYTLGCLRKAIAFVKCIFMLEERASEGSILKFHRNIEGISKESIISQMNT